MKLERKDFNTVLYVLFLLIFISNSIFGGEKKVFQTTVNYIMMTHTVRPNETLNKIANDYNNKGYFIDWKEIAIVNKILPPYIISINQELLIPLKIFSVLKPDGPKQSDAFKAAELQLDTLQDKVDTLQDKGMKAFNAAMTQQIATMAYEFATVQQGSIEFHDPTIDFATAQQGAINFHNIAFGSAIIQQEALELTIRDAQGWAISQQYILENSQRGTIRLFGDENKKVGVSVSGHDIYKKFRETPPGFNSFSISAKAWPDLKSGMEIAVPLYNYSEKSTFAKPHTWIIKSYEPLTRVKKKNLSEIYDGGFFLIDESSNLSSHTSVIQINPSTIGE